MGLELGPPWLVVVENTEEGFNVLYRDNFTGASLQRAISVRKHEPGSYAAVMHSSGSLARHADGALFDPIEETKGRNGGTYAERGHRALIVANQLFREDGTDKKQRPWYFWPLILGGVLWALVFLT